MNNITKTALRIFTFVAFFALTMTTQSCKDAEKKTDEAIEKFVKEINDDCPKKIGDDMTLTGVSVDEDEMAFRYEVKDAYFQTIDEEKSQEKLTKAFKNDNAKLIKKLAKKEMLLRLVYKSDNEKDSIVINLDAEKI